MLFTRESIPNLRCSRSTAVFLTTPRFSSARLMRYGTTRAIGPNAKYLLTRNPARTKDKDNPSAIPFIWPNCKRGSLFTRPSSIALLAATFPVGLNECYWNLIIFLRYKINHMQMYKTLRIFSFCKF